jgi:RES domain-containing protein
MPGYDGRYNRAGGPSAWYASNQLRAAWAELFRHTAGSGVSPTETLRRVGRLHVELDRVLDLTSATVRRAIGVTTEALVADDREVCQDMALAAIAGDYQGLLAPSAALPGARTLVVFRSGYDHVELISEEVSRPPRRMRDVLHRVPLVGTDHSKAARLVEKWVEDLGR